MSQSSPNIRLLAIKTLTPVLQQKGSLSANFDLNIAKLDEKERGWFQEVCFGTLRQAHLLLALSQPLLNKPLRNKDKDILAAILIGLYQLKFMRTPDHAAISETVNATKKLKKPWAVKLVNAVLRNFLREQASLDTQIERDFAAQTSHPQWLVDHLKESWPEHWKEILAANNHTAPLTLRVNQCKTSRDDYAQTLLQAHELGQLSDQAIVLREHADVTQLPGFGDGLVSVQDEAAQLSAQLLDLAPNQRVLDACCAPGGKTCHILEAESQLAEVVGIELEAHRLKRVEENLTRLGLSATLKVSDALETQQWWDGQAFDRILLDAPCSATGVIRRHPDIKLLRRPEDIAALAKLQGQLLDKLWPLLKPGGRLVYATCSVLPQENTMTVEAFLSRQTDAKLVPMEADWGQPQTAGRQLFPAIGSHDGFYYALLDKAV